ncbi:MAG TPA: hypothetical protein VN285_00595 [Candidatus Deferrimicrobium sp.]|nr:hypothetical protein [Candidatus Deferrimicrobium sp.]
MEVQPDFKELLELFNAHKVEYVVVGAYALAHHGVPRYTGDLDVLVRPDEDNARRILEALREFGFESTGLTAGDFLHPETVVQLGVAPVRVDILTSLTGVSWEDACAGRAEGRFGEVPVCFLGRRQFVLNKHALGRKKDIADLEALGEE